jgi:hypothetical protein
MNPIRRVTILVLVFAASSIAQALPTGKASTTRWMVDSEIGYDGLVSTNPHLMFGASIERPIGGRVELQGGASFSPDMRLTTNDDRSIVVTGMGLFWITQQFAVTGGVIRGNLSDSQSNRSGWTPSIGIAMREHIFNIPGRLYFAYAFPTGCQWGATCPIQSYRIQGPEGYWEHRIWPHFRLGVQAGYYHILNQGDPLDRAAGRTGEWTGDVHVLMRFEIPSGSLKSPY